MNIFLKAAKEYAHQATVYFRALELAGHDESKKINGMICLRHAEHYFEEYKKQMEPKNVTVFRGLRPS